GRLPDTEEGAGRGELLAWCNNMNRQPMTTADVWRAHNDYLRKHSDIATATTRRAYRAVFHREPQQCELNYWVNYLPSYSTPEPVFQRLTEWFSTYATDRHYRCITRGYDSLGVGFVRSTEGNYGWTWWDCG